MLVAMIAIQWSIVVQGALENWHHYGDPFHVIHLDITSLIKGDFAAGALLISMGACLGKLSHSQLLVMSFIEVVI